MSTRTPIEGADSAQWSRVEQAFLEALERPESERLPWLRSELADHPQLLARVEELLEADDAAGDFLEQPPPGLSRTSVLGRATTSPQRPDLVGQQLAQFRILELLGQGGMGEVYIAFDETLQRQVALKSIRGQHAENPQAKVRFLQEAQILSRLEHPNICQIHDYLETEHGAFLVLELIRGRDLRDFITGNASKKERLRVALEVANALVAAHKEGIVHRDLKPSNIMLTESGQVKVLDFGLAKSLSTPAADFAFRAESTTDGATPTQQRPSTSLEETLQGTTHPGHVMGTPGYMSPEQARAEIATPASDMYSFGLLLRELLAGKRLYPPDSDAVEMLMMAIRAEVPTTAGLPRPLRPLIEKLASADPSTRPSAEQARSTLERHLGRPRRLLLRGLAATGLAFLLLTVAGLWKYSQDLERHAIELASERSRVETAREEAEELVDFLIELFEITGPDQARGETITAQELLARGTEKLDRELQDQPEARARVLTTIGTIYRRLGLFDEARSSLQEALELRTREGVDDLDVAEVLWQLSVVDDHQARYADSEALLRRTLTILEARPDEAEPAKLASTLGSLAITLRHLGRLEESEELQRRTLAIYRDLPEPDEELVARSLVNLSLVLWSSGRTAEAEPLAKEALVLAERALGPDHPNIANHANILAVLQIALERFDDAERSARKALDVQLQVHEENHPALADPLVTLANIQAQRGHPEEAEPLYRRALDINRKALGEEHPKVAICLHNLGILRQDAGELDDAEGLFREALRIREDTLGPDHLATTSTLLYLGRLLHQTGRVREGLPLLQRAIAIREATYDDENPRMLEVLEALAAALRESGSPSEAIEVHRRLLEAERRVEPRRPDRLRDVTEHLAVLLEESGRTSEADVLRQELSGQNGFDGGDLR